MSNEIIRKGVFWLPSNPFRKIAGYLKYSNQDIRLDLIGSLENYKNSQKGFEYKIINGVLGTEAVLLYDSFETERNFYIVTMDYTSLISNIIFFGINATDPSDLKFHRCNTHFTQFEEWINKKDSFKIKIDRVKYKVNVEYSLPDPIEIQFNKSNKCRIIFTASGPSISYYQKDAIIQQSVKFAYDSKRKKNVSVLLKYISHFSKLLILFTQKPIFQSDTKVIVNGSKKQKKIEANIFRTYRDVISITKKVTPTEYLVNYFDIESKFINIVKKWFSYQSLVDVTLTNYFDNFFANTSIENQFLNILKSMESYHRELLFPRNMNQVDRYISLFLRTSRAFNCYLRIPSKVKFCEKLRDTRNDLTHNNPTVVEIQKNFKKLYRLTMEVRLILTSNILFDIGLDIKEIKKLIGRSTVFQSVKR